MLYVSEIVTTIGPCSKVEALLLFLSIIVNVLNANNLIWMPFMATGSRDYNNNNNNKNDDDDETMATVTVNYKSDTTAKIELLRECNIYNFYTCLCVHSIHCVAIYKLVAKSNDKKKEIK